MAEAAIAEVSAVLTPVAAPVVPPVPLQKMLPERDFGQAAYKRNVWLATLPPSVPFETIFEPKFWGHVAKSLRINDIIEIHAEDASWFAEVYVVAAHRLSANVVLLRKHDLVPAAEVAAPASPLSIKYRGPHARYCVMRGDDVVQDKFQTEAEAMVELAKLRNAF